MSRRHRIGTGQLNADQNLYLALTAWPAQAVESLLNLEEFSWDNITKIHLKNMKMDAVRLIINQLPSDLVTLELTGLSKETLGYIYHSFLKSATQGKSLPELLCPEYATLFHNHGRQLMRVRESHQQPRRQSQVHTSASVGSNPEQCFDNASETTNGRTVLPSRRQSQIHTSAFFASVGSNPEQPLNNDSSEGNECRVSP